MNTKIFSKKNHYLKNNIIDKLFHPPTVHVCSPPPCTRKRKVRDLRVSSLCYTIWVLWPCLPGLTWWVRFSEVQIREDSCFRDAVGSDNRKETRNRQPENLAERYATHDVHLSEEVLFRSNDNFRSKRYRAYTKYCNSYLRHSADSFSTLGKKRFSLNCWKAKQIVFTRSILIKHYQ